MNPPLRPLPSLRRWTALLLTALLTACGNRAGPDSVEENAYQGPIGEAVFRQLLADLPNFEDNTPKVYALALYGNLLACEQDFTDRFKDTGRTFCNVNLMKVRNDGVPLDPTSNLSPIILQIKIIQRDGDNAYRAETGWSYKDRYQLREYRITGAPDRKPTVTLTRLINSGTWKPGDTKPEDKTTP